MQIPTQAIIFDFDGTLADTFPAIHLAFNAALEPILGRTFSHDEVIARFGPNDQGMLENDLREFPSQTLQDAIETYFEVYTAAHDEIFAFEGVEEMFLELERRRVPFGLMTGKSRRAADISLAHLGWSQKFEIVVAGEEVAHPKPAPDGPLRAAELMGFEPQNCLYVGDSPADLGAARAAGMKPVVAGWHLYFEALLRAMGPENWASKPNDVLLFLD